jgi:hypothetical protein
MLICLEFIQDLRMNIVTSVPERQLSVLLATILPLSHPISYPAPNCFTALENSMRTHLGYHPTTLQAVVSAQ